MKTEASERERVPGPWVWLCVILMLGAAAAIAALYQWSVWVVILIALFLACPVAAVRAYLIGIRPLPVPLGPVPETRGLTLNWIAPWYDSLWCPAFGLGRRYRERTLALAGLRQGDRVLDVGCGTGWLTRHAAQIAGPSGAAWGIDPAPDMIRMAMQEAARTRNGAQFKLAAIESLPFENSSFDVAVTSLVIHHLPPDLKIIGLSEVYRVLKPGGRLLVAEPDRPDHWLLRAVVWPMRFHPDMKDHLNGRIPEILQTAGFESVMIVGHWWAGCIAFWTAWKPSRETNDRQRSRPS